MRRLVMAVGMVAMTSLSVCGAQTAATASRADGGSTPLMVYEAAGGGGRCAPLAVISHGAGGSEKGYVYLAQAMAQQGYTAVVMGHRQSGMEAMRHDMRAYGVRDGVEALVKDPQAESDRLLDVGAALSWAKSRCGTAGTIPFRVLLGHSMGSETVMLELGIANSIGVASPPAGQDRFDAYVALSPEGPGVVFPEGAWKTIRRPVLVMTGTRDQSLKGGPAARQVPWKEMPGAKGTCQWMGVIDGATHMNFGGVGLGSERVTPLVTSTVATFLSEVRTLRCTVPPPVAGMSLVAK